MSEIKSSMTLGVLAIQGAFVEHVYHLKRAVDSLQEHQEINLTSSSISIIEVRTKDQLEKCDGLVIPGGESTAISLVAESTGMLQPLRDFVHNTNKAVWGTCAGLILVANQASGARKGGQELLGGLDVSVARNHFGSQTDSFAVALEIPVLQQHLSVASNSEAGNSLFNCVFIRAPIVEAINISSESPTVFYSVFNDESVPAESFLSTSVVKAPIPAGWEQIQRTEKVEVLATLPAELSKSGQELCVAVRQGRIIGTSFHPELTEDTRLHQWWIKKCVLGI